MSRGIQQYRVVMIYEFLIRMCTLHYDNCVLLGALARRRGGIHLKREIVGVSHPLPKQKVNDVENMVVVEFKNRLLTVS